MSSIKVADLNWMDRSGSWFEQWINVRNGCEIIVVRDKKKDTWMCQHAVSITNIFLVGWFRGDRDSALKHFAGKLFEFQLGDGKSRCNTCDDQTFSIQCGGCGGNIECEGCQAFSIENDWFCQSCFENGPELKHDTGESQQP